MPHPSRSSSLDLCTIHNLSKNKFFVVVQPFFQIKLVFQLPFNSLHLRLYADRAFTVSK
jgi:hypothetical protein